MGVGKSRSMLDQAGRENLNLLEESKVLYFFNLQGSRPFFPFYIQQDYRF